MLILGSLRICIVCWFQDLGWLLSSISLNDVLFLEVIPL